MFDLLKKICVAPLFGLNLLLDISFVLFSFYFVHFEFVFTAIQFKFNFFNLLCSRFHLPLEEVRLLLLICHYLLVEGNMVQIGDFYGTGVAYFFRSVACVLRKGHALATTLAADRVATLATMSAFLSV